jgi:ferredoxin-NADP reductase
MGEAFRAANWISQKLTFLAGGSGLTPEVSLTGQKNYETAKRKLEHA